MPPSKRKKLEKPPRDPAEIILELEAKLETLQRDYNKCQIQLEKVLQENKELKKLLSIDIISSNVKQNNNDKKISSLRRSLRTAGKSQRSEETLPDLENKDGDNIEEDNLCIDIKQDVDYIVEPEDEDYVPEAEDYQDSSPPTANKSSNTSSDSGDEDNFGVNRSRNSKVKKRRKENKADTARRKNKWRDVESRRNAQSEPKGLEIDIVNFLDDILSTQMKQVKTARTDDIPTFGASGLAAFHVVLGNKLDSYIRDEANKLAPNVITGVSKRHEIRYFSAVPSADPYIQEDATRRRLAMFKPDSKPPNNRNKRFGESDLVATPSKFRTDLCSTFNGEEPFVFICEICGAPFDTSSKFSRHMISHSEPTHACPVCGKLFKRKDDMAKHTNSVHERVYRFQCRMCPKQFTDASGFRKHERCHLNIKPHMCDICGKGFAELRTVRQHTAKQHSGTDLPHRVKLVV